jgi:DNA-binding NarL/FixJ family response regulator
MVKVLVVDDHALIRRVIREVLWQETDLEIVAEACNGYEAEILASKAQPDVVLMDLDMPGRGGLDATERVLACSPNSRVIVLTASRSEQHAISAIQRGAVGYLTKDIEPETLIHAIRCAVRDELYLTRPIASRVLAYFRSLQLPSDMDPMQPRLSLASKKTGTGFKELVETPAPLVAVQSANGPAAMRNVAAEVDASPAIWETDMGGSSLQGRNQSYFRPSDHQAFPPPSERERGFLDRLRRGRRQDPRRGSRDMTLYPSVQFEAVTPPNGVAASSLARSEAQCSRPSAHTVHAYTPGSSPIDRGSSRSGVTSEAHIIALEEQPTGKEVVVHKHALQTTGSFRVKLVGVH